MQLSRKYQIILVLWLIAIAASAVWNISSASKNTREIVLSRARSYFSLIQIVRHWNAMYGGVYVPVTKNIEPNPYLTSPDRDIRTVDGLILTKINPALMTRQLAGLMEMPNSLQIHLTSLNPIRPENAPDEWEQNALARFEKGDSEHLDLLNSGKTYRYMAPLIVEESCMECHAAQGYRVGDIRGGISIGFPSSNIRSSYLSHVNHIVLVHLAALLAGTGAILLMARLSDRAQRQTEEKNRLFKDMADLTNAIHWEVDIATLKFTYISPRVEELLGYPASSWTDFNFWVSTLHPGDREWAPSYCNEQTVKGKDHVFSYRCIAANGQIVWIRDLVNVITDDSGTPVKLRGLFIDDTLLKEGEEKLRRSLKEKEVMLKEIHHRVRNNLAIVSSLLSLQSKQIDDRKYLEMFRESQSRIKSLSLVHEKLYEKEDFYSFNIRDYVLSLAGHTGRSFSTDAPVEVFTDIDQIELDIDTLVPFGLILNELLVNAYKHAFDGKENPSVTVNLKKLDDRQLRLSVADNGTGLPDGFDLERDSDLGLDLVQLLVRQLDGTLEVRSEQGANFSVVFRRQDGHPGLDRLDLNDHSTA